VKSHSALMTQHSHSYAKHDIPLSTIKAESPSRRWSFTWRSIHKLSSMFPCSHFNGEPSPTG